MRYSNNFVPLKLCGLVVGKPIAARRMWKGSVRLGSPLGARGSAANSNYSYTARIGVYLLTSN